jgi:small subunit ribosomal protein S17
MQGVLKGVVVSDKMDGTVVVCVEQRKFHIRYKKLIVRTKRLAVDKNGLTVFLGDRVCIERAKRMSKTKSWRLVNILSGF